MRYIYAINHNHSTWPRLSIEADQYRLEDGFFHFAKAVEGRSGGVKVASVKADLVFDISRTDKEQ